MKIFLRFFTLLLFTSCQNSGLQKLNYSEYQDLILSRDMPELSEITIRDEHGQVISVDSMMSLHHSGEYFDRFFKDGKGQVVAYQLEPKPVFRDIPIACDRVGLLLDSVYLIDQQIRQRFDPRQDYANMEIVANVIEKCGMPNSPRAAKAIFMVVQHNHNIHQKKHIEAFRAAAQKGSIAKSSLALMEDRMPTHEGKPQLYGTQVRRRPNEEQWELFELADPERVDQRRAEMGLGPIKPYLENYGIAFTVEQIAAEQQQ